MAKSKLELAVNTGQWNRGLREAQQALAKFTKDQGGLDQAVTKNSQKMAQFVQIMGNTKSTAATASGQMKEYRSMIERCQVVVAQLNGEDKKLAEEGLMKLIQRYREAKKQAENFGHALEGVNSKAGNMNIAGLNITGLGDANGMLTELGSSLGMNTQLLGALSTGSIAAAGAIAGVAAGAAAAAKAFYDYNTELGHQNQIVEVTTGLIGENADAMRDQMRAVSKVYGVDFRESINAVNTLMTQFGISGDEATKLIRKGMQGMIQGDGPKLLQMIQQYAPAYRDAGIEASELVAIINNTEGGIFTDQNMSAITMGIKNIRIMKDTTKEAMQSIGIDADTMARRLNDGTMSVFDALKQVSDKIDEVGPGSQAAGEIMNDIFGKQGVAAGTNLGKAIAQLNLNLDETSRQTGGVGEKLAELTEKTAIFEREMNKAFGVKNFEEFKVAIESKVLDTLNGVLITFNKIKDAIKSTGMNFSTAISGMVTTLEALNPKLKILHDIASYFHDIGEEAKYAGDQIANIPDIPTADDGTPLQGPAGLLAAANSGKTVKPQRSEVKYSPTSYRGEGSTTGTHSHSGKTGTTKNEETEEQRYQRLIREAEEKYIKAKTQGHATEMAQLQKEIQAYDAKLKAIKAAREEAHGNSFEAGSLGDLQNQLKELEALKPGVKTKEEWDDLANKINDVKQKIDSIQGVEKKVDVGIGISGMNAEAVDYVIKDIQTRLRNADFGTPLHESLSSQLADVTAFKNIIETAFKNGLKIDSSAFEGLWEDIGDSIDIPESVWQTLINDINSQLQDKKIRLNFETGDITTDNVKPEEDKRGIEDKEWYNDTTKVVNGLSQVASGLQSMGVKIPESVQKVITAIQGAMTVVQGASTIISVFSSGSQTANTAATTANTVAIGALTTALAANTAAVTANSVASLIPFANGGFTHADNGVITGSHFSGDIQPLMVNAGEAVINQADQSALFRALKDGNLGGGGSIQSVGVRGTDLLLCLNNELRSQGKPTL